MTTGLDATFNLLSTTPNEAAAPVLISALDSENSEIRKFAAQGLLQRNSRRGEKAILHRLHENDPQWRSILREYPGRMTTALRDAVVGDNPQNFENACRAILWLREFQIATTLVTVMEDPKSHFVDGAAQTLLGLARILYEELARPRDYSVRRDPQNERRKLLAPIEASLARFRTHQRREVVEAFLMLVHRDDLVLQKLIHDPQHPAYLVTLDVLTHSQHGGISRLLLSFLDDAKAPRIVLKLVARRGDLRFVQRLLDRFSEDRSANFLANLKRLESVSWIPNDVQMIRRLEPNHQSMLASFAQATGISHHDRFELVRNLLDVGTPQGRADAVRCLMHYSSSEADQLVLRALEDTDEAVLAEAALQLRERSITGALSRAIQLLDHDSERVREAARKNLAEFTAERYIESFDSMSEQAKRFTGELVLKVDPSIVDLIQRELRSPSRAARLRAMEMARDIGAVNILLSELIGNLDENDHVIRQSAVDTLGRSADPRAIAAIRRALNDQSPIVREAAMTVLEQADPDLMENDLPRVSSL